MCVRDRNNKEHCDGAVVTVVDIIVVKVNIYEWQEKISSSRFIKNMFWPDKSAQVCYYL